MAAGLNINYKGDVKAIIKDLDFIQKQIVPEATASAINKTIAKDRTQNVRKVAQLLNISPQRLVRERFIIRKATRRYLRGHLIVLTAGIPVDKMRHSWSGPNKKGGIRAGNRRFPAGFKAQAKNQHRYAFSGNVYAWQRKDLSKFAERLPIERIKISISPHAERIARAQQISGRAEFVKQFTRELQYRLQRKGLI